MIQEIFNVFKDFKLLQWRSEVKIPGPEDDFWYDQLSSSTIAGIEVDEFTALTYTAVWACIRLLAETVATLPCFLYERNSTGRKLKTNHPIHKIFHDQANEELSAMNFREIMMYHLASWGNFYAEKVYDKMQVRELWPIAPHRVIPFRKNGQIIYEVTINEGDKRYFTREKIYHIPAFGYDGLVGHSPIWKAREAIALGLAAQELGSRFYSSGTNLGGIISLPTSISEKAERNIKDSLLGKYSGLGKSHRIMILEEGMQYERLGIPPNEAQFLETRKFQIEEVCRIFRVKPHMIAHLDRSTYNNIEHESIEFVMHTIRPWLVRIEQAARMQLLRPQERNNLYLEHAIEGLLRADSQSRGEFYNQMSTIGAYCINDIRSKENLPPIENGDEHFVGMNLVPLSRIYDYTDSLIEKKNSMGQNSIENKKAVIYDIRDYWEKEIKTIETAEERGIKERKKIESYFRGIIKDHADHIVTKEVKAVKKALQKQFQEKDLTSFNEWLDGFYDDLRDFIRKRMAPVIIPFGEAIFDAAKREVDVSDIEDDLSTFIEEYLNAGIGRYINSSIGQIRKLMKEYGADEIQDIITERLDEWGETKSDKIADDEAVRCHNAVASMVFLGAGYRLVWRVTSSDPCAYCRAMNGKVIKKGEYFVKEGDSLNPDGADTPMKITGSKIHPPLHRKCKCTISHTS